MPPLIHSSIVIGRFFLPRKYCIMSSGCTVVKSENLASLISKLHNFVDTYCDESSKRYHSKKIILTYFIFLTFFTILDLITQPHLSN